MPSVKKTLLFWSPKRVLRSYISSSPSVSAYTSRVQDAWDKRDHVDQARCITNDTSHTIKDKHMMADFTEVASPPAFQHKSLRVDMGISHIVPTTYACSSYATSTSEFRSQIFSTKMENHVRMLATETRPIKEQCWSCGRFKSEKGFLTCPSCNAVQPPDPNITYFKIFNQDQKFDLDLKDLETNYKNLMKRLHPDLTHGKSPEEKENYAYWSALVTTAYTDLLKPVSRATYLLKLRGIHVEEEGTVTDSDLIMEVMEIREALERKPTKTVLGQLNKQAMARMDEWSRAFKTALEEGNDTAAVGALQRMSYFGRVCTDITRELL